MSWLTPIISVNWQNLSSFHPAQRSLSEVHQHQHLTHQEHLDCAVWLHAFQRKESSFLFLCKKGRKKEQDDEIDRQHSLKNIFAPILLDLVFIQENRLYNIKPQTEGFRVYLWGKLRSSFWTHNCSFKTAKSTVSHTTS